MKNVRYALFVIFFLISIISVSASISWAGTNATVSSHDDKNSVVSEQGDCLLISQQDDLITVQTNKMPLGQFLKEFAARTGARITLKNSSVAKHTVSINFKQLPFNKAVRIILNGYSYTSYSVKGVPIVTVFGPKTGQPFQGPAETVASTIPSSEPTRVHTAKTRIDRSPLSLDEFRPIITEQSLKEKELENPNKDDAMAAEDGSIGEEEQLQDRLDRALDAIQSEYDNLHSEALHELEGMDNPEATATLIQVASGKAEKVAVPRTEAVEVLWHHAADLNFTDKGSVAALQQLANDSDPEVSVMAQKALRDRENYNRRNSGQ